MKHFLRFSLPLLLAGVSFVSLSAAPSVTKKFMKPSRPWMSVLGKQVKTNKSLQLEKAGIDSRPKFGPSRVAETPDYHNTATSWNMIEGPDGRLWSYTQKNTEENYMLTSSELTFFDADHNQVGHFTITVPEGKPINSILPYGPITKKIFDTNDKTLEFMVYQHEIGEDYSSIDSTFIYNMDGEKVLSYNASNIMIVNASRSTWDTYYRVVMDRTEEIDGKDVQVVDILSPASWYDDYPVVEHTFNVDAELINYSDGPYLNACIINNNPYYVISHYAKPYMDGYDPETWEPVVTPDNGYCLEVYDKNYERVDSFSVSLDKPETSYYRFASFGMLSDCDMSKNYFDSDDDFKYIITYYDYSIATDDYVYEFDVVNNQGEKVNTICNNVVNTYFKLADIKGQSDQYAFMQSIDGAEQIQMVNLPSCEKAVTIPAAINGEAITTTLERYPVGDSYQYVIQMGRALTDESGNVISRIGWYDPDLTLDRFVSFNITANGQLFTPLITSESLNPYLFDTDSDHDYIYIAKIKRNNSSVIDNILFVAHENGDTITSFKGDDNTTGALYTASLLDAGTPNSQLFVCHYNLANDVYDMNYYKLPFIKFAGGNGSEEDPYLIASAGDMMQIAAAPEASYKIIKDIDMSELNWEPISTFSGKLNGANHSINNLYISSEESKVGLFSALNPGGKIEKLMINSPVIEISDNCSFAGVIAGSAVTDTLSHVIVKDANFIDPSGEAWCTVGGLVGQATSLSLIDNCGFLNGTINVPSASELGGIAGSARTSSYVTNCAASGDFTSGRNLGGIVGSGYNDAKISDCHVNANLKAKNLIGGIMADNGSRSPITRCVAEGTIEASEPNYSGAQVGGIAGSLASDWEFGTDTIISNCVSGMQITSADMSSGEADATVHRIVGRTIDNEWYEEGEEHYKENGLANNYVLATATVNGNDINSDDATSVEGASKTIAELTNDFFTELGYSFYTDNDESNGVWMMTDALPYLYFEDVNYNGVDNITSNAANSAIQRNGKTFSYDGAARMMIYSLNGQVVKTSISSSIDAGNLAPNVYIVKAVTYNGKAVSAKVIIR